jgi:predicted nucleic acid-binding protein
VIVLDTNVVSELLKPHPDPGVVRWVQKLREQPVTTVLNRAELLGGAALLPDGRRRDRLVEGIARILSDLGLVLPFTLDCAPVYATVRAVCTLAGRPIGTMDALIASVALVHGASVATRDVDGFTRVGLTVHDPWTGGRVTP